MFGLKSSGQIITATIFLDESAKTISNFFEAFGTSALQSKVPPCTFQLFHSQVVKFGFSFGAFLGFIILD